MKSAGSLFDDADHAAIAAAIAEAEKKTRGQIVPVVATVSGRYDRAEDLFGLTFAILVLTIAWLTMQANVADAWSGAPTPLIGLPVVVDIIVAGFVIGAWLATRFPVLRLPFIPRSEMQAEVERAAHAAFHTQRIRNTTTGTGLLIYVSLYEHMVRVIADDGIAEKMARDDWEAVCQAVVAGMRRGEPAAGLVDGVTRAGAVLAALLPPEAGATNELADRLVILD